MKILLSPAKSINTTGIELQPEVSTIEFLKEATTLAGKLKKMSVKKIEKLMHVSKDIAELNYTRFQQWEYSSEQSNNMVPAAFAFNGEVYKGLSIADFTSEELERAQKSIRILSGMYGVLKPLDLIFPYRLEMGTKWNITPKQKNLYQFWGSKLSKSLNTEVDKEDVIINLASTEYFKAIDKKVLKAKVITPVFKEFKNGEFKIVMMYAKHARGAMARYIIKNNLQSADELKLYSVDGYTLDINQSTEDEWVFVR